MGPKRVYSGWHGVQDNIHVLLAVSFEPESGSLCCKFSTGEPRIHVGVPERMYQILLKSPYAGSYYRKHIRGVYPCPYETVAPKFKESDVPEKKLRKMAAKRLEALPETKMDLFGVVSPTRSPSKQKRA